MLWIAGFAALFAFDLFMEIFVFEWLEWNGPTKNDWFFILWWFGVGLWFVYGAVRLVRRLTAR